MKLNSMSDIFGTTVREARKSDEALDLDSPTMKLPKALQTNVVKGLEKKEFKKSKVFDMKIPSFDVNSKLSPKKVMSQKDVFNFKSKRGVDKIKSLGKQSKFKSLFTFGKQTPKKPKGLDIKSQITLKANTTPKKPKGFDVAQYVGLKSNTTATKPKSVDISKYTGYRGNTTVKTPNVANMIGMKPKSNMHVKKVVGIRGVQPNRPVSDSQYFKRVNQQKKLSLWGDADGDGVKNVLDCQPLNPFRQGPENNTYEFTGAIQPGAPDYTGGSGSMEMEMPSVDETTASVTYNVEPDVTDSSTSVAYPQRTMTEEEMMELERKQELKAQRDADKRDRKQAEEFLERQASKEGMKRVADAAADVRVKQIRRENMTPTEKFLELAKQGADVLGDAAGAVSGGSGGSYSSEIASLREDLKNATTAAERSNIRSLIKYYQGLNTKSGKGGSVMTAGTYKMSGQGIREASQLSGSTGQGVMVMSQPAGTTGEGMMVMSGATKGPSMGVAMMAGARDSPISSMEKMRQLSYIGKKASTADEMQYEESLAERPQPMAYVPQQQVVPQQVAQNPQVAQADPQQGVYSPASGRVVTYRRGPYKKNR